LVVVVLCVLPHLCAGCRPPNSGSISSGGSTPLLSWLQHVLLLLATSGCGSLLRV
jgi:hypothetical protein